MKRIFPFAILLAAFSCTTPQTARTENTDSLALADSAWIEAVDEQTTTPSAPSAESSEEPATTPNATHVDLARAKSAAHEAASGIAATNSPDTDQPAHPETEECAGTIAEQPASQIAEVLQPADRAIQIEETKSDESSPAQHAGSTDTHPIMLDPEVRVPELASPLVDSSTPGPESTVSLNVDSLITLGTDAPFTLGPDSLGTPGKKTRFLPMRRRMDREINKIKYVRKGEIMFGLTASYGTLDSDDTDLWLVIDNINLNASIFTVNPFVGYFFRDNLAIGARFGYSEVSGNLASADLNLGETNDINFGVNDITLKNKDISFGLFVRSYAGLDPKGHFGLFGELELSMSSGSSEFGYRTNGDLRQTFGDNTKVKLSFNPGMAVYIFPNVCSTISFGLGGLQYVKTTQKDGEGNRTGSRTYSNLRFRLNLADIRIGLTIHMWNKKKSL